MTFQTPAEQCAKEMAAADIVLVTQRRAFVDRVGDIYLRVVAGERDQTEKDYLHDCHLLLAQSSLNLLACTDVFCLVSAV